jgi:FolB domain-containing protein
MTLFLASVAGPQEAEIALAHGADIIDLKDATKGALGALEPELVRATVKAIGSRRPVSAVTGDLPMQPHVIVDAVTRMAEAGVDYVKVGLFPSPQREDCIRALSALAERTKIVGVMFADRQPDSPLAPMMADSGFAGAMLDTADKRNGRLLDHIDITDLSEFTDTLHAHGLMAGLAGSLEPPDVPRLLLLAPDFLGFRGALCAGHDRKAGLNAEATAMIRALIPADERTAGSEHLTSAKVDYRLLSARGYAPDKGGTVTDRVFVRDLILPVRIGAYAREREKPQSVRFNVNATVLRAGHAVEDMRDVFSYDLVTDGIRMIVAQEHIPFVETLAERIAGLVLAHPRVTGVTVKVEKLDVGPGAVGVEITRERPAEVAKVHHLFPPRVSEPDGR